MTVEGRWSAVVVPKIIGVWLLLLGASSIRTASVYRIFQPSPMSRHPVEINALIVAMGFLCFSAGLGVLFRRKWGRWLAIGVLTVRVVWTTVQWAWAFILEPLLDVAFIVSMLLHAWVPLLEYLGAISSVWFLTRSQVKATFR